MQTVKIDDQERENLAEMLMEVNEQKSENQRLLNELEAKDIEIQKFQEDLQNLRHLLNPQVGHQDQMHEGAAAPAIPVPVAEPTAVGLPKQRDWEDVPQSQLE